MAGLPWFELDTDYHDSPKVEALKSRLRNPEADAFPSRLYAYCYKHAIDRFDPEVAAYTIEAAAKWRGRRGVLFDALFAVGVLEREAGKVVVHGVSERLAPHLAKRQGDAERQKRRRDRLVTSNGRHATVTRDVTRESLGDKDKDKDRDITDPPLPPVSEPAKRPVRPARVGVGHPAFEAIQHWYRVAWPAMSPAPCPAATEREAASLAQVCNEHGIPAVTAAMDRATADKFWHDKLTLSAFAENFARFLPRHDGQGAPTPKPKRVVGVDALGQPIFAEAT